MIRVNALTKRLFCYFWFYCKNLVSEFNHYLVQKLLVKQFTKIMKHCYFEFHCKILKIVKSNCETIAIYPVLCIQICTSSLDPDPGFWPSLDPDPNPGPDPDPGYYYQFWKKKFKKIKKKIFFFKTSIFF